MPGGLTKRRCGAARAIGAVLLVAWAALALPPAQAAERTILFIDDADVLYRPGTRKQVTPLTKHADNPVIAPDRPWEGMIGWVSTYRDPASGKCQMWYQAYNERRTEDKRLKCVVAYAESADGLTWVKPELDLFPYYETPRTNIVLIGAPDAYGDRYCNSVLFDPRETDPARRYKMAYYDWMPNDARHLGAGTHVAFSPDGMHWTKHPGLVVPTAYGAKGVEPPLVGESVYVERPGKGGQPRRAWYLPMSMSDAIDVFFDARLGRYVGYGKMWIPAPDGKLGWKHALGRIESANFVDWSEAELVLAPDEHDPPQLEFHTSPVFPYRGLYLSLNQLLNRSAGTIDIELMSSRDGRRWERAYRGQTVLPRGPSGSFDAATLLTNGTPLEVGDALYFYYGAYRGTAIGGVGLDRQVAGSTDYHSGVGLATLRRDRFVGVSPDPRASLRNYNPRTAGDKPEPPENTVGQVTLRPLDLTGATAITLNADATGGAVRLEVLDPQGFRLSGFTRDEAVPLTGDALRHAPRWRERSLADLPPGKYLLRVHLDRATLYAVTVERNDE